MNTPKAKQRVKAGTSKAAAEARKNLFVEAYIGNGNNATRAAIAAGYAPTSAEQAGMRLKKDVRVTAAIAGATEAAAKIAGLDVARTLRELARLAYADPGRLYAADGTLIPIRELDEEVRATIASVEVEHRAKDGGGEVPTTVKVKVWDKNAALEKAMKSHGLYESDNRQKPPTVVVVAGLDADL